MLMDISEIQKRLVKPATKLIAGGFRPTNSNEESWLAKVFLYQADEEIPTDVNNEPMLPLAQLYLPTLSNISPQLHKTELITVFISKNLPEQFEEMGNNWLIREYSSNKDLTRKDLSSPQSHLKPFALKPEQIPQDFPQWDGEDIPSDIRKTILELEKNNVIESYFDICGEHCYEHKIGGYPSFCQSGIYFGDGYEFIFQISSDAKINLNVVDSGSLLFAKNHTENKWKIYYDFY